VPILDFGFWNWFFGSTRKAEGRRQKAGGRRQKAEGRRQKEYLFPSPEANLLSESPTIISDLVAKN
jgi:hypothetical protein